MSTEYDSIRRFRAELEQHGASDEWTATYAATQIDILTDDIVREIRFLQFFYLEYMAWLGARRNSPGNSDNWGYAQRVEGIECTLSKLDEWLSCVGAEYKGALPEGIAAAMRHAEVAVGHRPLVEAIQKDIGTMGKPHWYWVGKLLAKRLWRILPMAVTVLGLLALTDALVANLILSSGWDGVHRLLITVAAIAGCGFGLRVFRW
jgi:hypothetical protein